MVWLIFLRAGSNTGRVLSFPDFTNFLAIDVEEARRLRIR
jgi:hypothetical protein